MLPEDIETREKCPECGAPTRWDGVCETKNCPASEPEDYRKAFIGRIYRKLEPPPEAELLELTVYEPEDYPGQAHPLIRARFQTERDEIHSFCALPKMPGEFDGPEELLDSADSYASMLYEEIASEVLPYVLRNRHEPLGEVASTEDAMENAEAIMSRADEPRFFVRFDESGSILYSEVPAEAREFESRQAAEEFTEEHNLTIGHNYWPVRLDECRQPA